MGVKVTNNGFGTISAGINSSATTVVLDSGQGARFPTLASGDFFFGTLVDTSNNIEVIKVTARSSDSMTVLRAQDNTTARAFSIGDRFELRPTAALFENAHLDNTPTSTGSLGLPKGTTAQQPTASATEGHIRYDTDDDVVYFSNGTNWVKISSAVPTLTSVSGTLFAGAGSNLTLAGTNFLSANLVVNFTQTSDSINTNVTVTPSSDSAATVAVPSAVFSNVTAGNVVSIKVTNSDNISSTTQTITTTALPSGGTISTHGSYRVHTFLSSSNFVNTIANLSADVLIVAGGGGGTKGTHGGAGGGAGGMQTAAKTLSVASHTVTVGGGGAGGGGSGSRGTSGQNSVFSGTTSTGGGGAGVFGGSTYEGLAGGSGGGAGENYQSSGTKAGGAGTSGQGSNGGSTDQTFGGGGGGGKGAVGGAAQSTNVGGTGGAGGTNDYRTGSNVTYAGGGGGNGDSGGGAGGSGGGGNSGAANGNAASGAGSNGTANTGGGGGACGATGSSGAGGAGIVVIRYTL